MAADFHALGFGVIHNLLTPAEVETARQRVEALHVAGKHDTRRSKGDVVITNLQSKDPWFIGLLQKPALEAILKPLLNDPFYPSRTAEQPSYIVGEYIARSSGPVGSPRHMDAWMPAAGQTTTMVQLVIALEDRGAAEGCTVVIPGSHLLGKAPYGGSPAPPSPSWSRCRREKRGPCGLPAVAWHRGQNLQEFRMGVGITFQQWWVRQRYDIPATLSPELRSRLTVRQLALLGCYVTAPLDEYEEGYDSEGRRLYGSPP